MRRLSLIACYLLSLATLMACDQTLQAETQITLRVGADQALQDRLSHLRVHVSLREPDKWRAPQSVEVPRSALFWPVDIPVNPRSSGEANAQFEVVVEAVTNGVVFAQTRALTRFKEGARPVLELTLRVCADEPSGYCAMPGCQPETCKTCNALGRCDSVVFVEPANLPPLVGEGEELDAGVDPAQRVDGATRDGSSESDRAIQGEVGANPTGPSATSDAASVMQDGANPPLDATSAALDGSHPKLDGASALSDSATATDSAAALDSKAPIDSASATADGAQPDVDIVDVCNPNPCSPGLVCSRTGTRCTRADLGKGNGTDVITIGDSWMLLTFTGIQESLAKAAMQPYRKYGVPGTRVLDGQIPGQFDAAIRADPNIKTVVMTAGSNDLFLASGVSDCATGGPNCTAQLDRVAVALDALWKKMSESGVQDVVHVLYSKAMYANNPVLNLAAHNARLAALCASHPPLRCFQLNTDTLVATLRADGLHPTDAGFDAVGRAVLDLMVKEGMRR